MNIFVIDGYLGSGKTSGISLLAHYYALRSGCTLFSNYGLSGSYDFKSYKDFLAVTMENSSIVCLDECHSFLDSRFSSNKGIVFFTQLTYYLRKMRTTLFLTSPQFDSIDKRVRNLCQVYVFAERNKDKFIYHFYDYQSGEFLKTLTILKNKAIPLLKRLYDTYTIVTPLELPQSDREYSEFTSILKSYTDNKLQEVRNSFPS